MKLTEEELNRFERHTLLEEVGESGQLKLKNGKVLIIGAGGLGSPAALYLAAAGVGTIGLVDTDVVDISNLQRQIIHSTKDVGKAKVDSAKQSILEINPYVKVNVYNEFITEENADDIIKEYDFVIEATDNFETIFLINDVCARLKKPFSHAGVIRFEGQAMTYVPDKGPCYRCIFKEVPKAGTVPTSKEVGIIGVLPGILGSMQALEAIKYLIGIGELLIGRMFRFDGLKMEARTIRLPKADCNCKACANGNNKNTEKG